MQTKLDKYRLSEPAQEDLETIWAYSQEKWSNQAADEYTDHIESAIKKLVSMPLIARERLEINPPVRIHTIARHIIIYRINGNALDVLRILGGQQNWQRILNTSTD